MKNKKLCPPLLDSSLLKCIIYKSPFDLQIIFIENLYCPHEPLHNHSETLREGKGSNETAAALLDSLLFGSA